MQCRSLRARLAGCTHPQLLGPFSWVCEQEGLFRGFQKHPPPPPHPAKGLLGPPQRCLQP